MQARTKPRIFYMLSSFPELSQTYILTELRMLWEEYDIRIAANKHGHQAVAAPFPYRVVPKRDRARLRAEIEAFAPDVLHGHWLLMLPHLHEAALMTGRPYTVRAHSFDVFQSVREPARRKWLAALNSEYCLGVLAFPFGRPLLEGAGVRADKIVDCRPVVDVGRFYDQSPNGEGIMNVGACLKKKNVEGYLEFATSMPDLTFDYYAIGYRTEKLRALNERLGTPVAFHCNHPYEDMPAAYKAHRWLVYSASPDPNETVGWPMAVAEAQAAGTGVCLLSARPDQKMYVGEGGICFGSFDEIREIIRGPVPEDMRRAGFEQAKKSDFACHRRLLEDLWRPALARPPRLRRKGTLARKLMRVRGPRQSREKQTPGLAAE